MKTKHTILFLVTSFLSTSINAAINLDGTIFNRAAKKYKIDPLLIYSVALAESALERKKGLISPWPWTLRAKSPFYIHSYSKAKKKLIELQKKYGTDIDVGLMQINLRWNSYRVPSVMDLLIPEKNIMIGTQILSESIKSAPNDLVLGIGRYHNWSNEKIARQYGKKILIIRNNLLNQ